MLLLIVFINHYFHLMFLVMLTFPLGSEGRIKTETHQVTFPARIVILKQTIYLPILGRGTKCSQQRNFDPHKLLVLAARRRWGGAAAGGDHGVLRRRHHFDHDQRHHHLLRPQEKEAQHQTG
jgi:hypothetical protein